MIKAANVQLEGMERKWTRDGINAWNPQVGLLAGKRELCNQMFALPPG
jgi:hypothetical protein